MPRRSHAGQTDAIKKQEQSRATSYGTSHVAAENPASRDATRGAGRCASRACPARDAARLAGLDLSLQPVTPSEAALRNTVRSHDSSAIYSTRNASIGSTRAARKAGIRPARLERINPEHRQLRSHFTKGGASEGSHCHPIAIGTNRQTHAEKGGTTYIDGAVLRQS